MESHTQKETNYVSFTPVFFLFYSKRIWRTDVAIIMVGKYLTPDGDSGKSKKIDTSFLDMNI